jgi:cytochrome c553
MMSIRAPVQLFGMLLIVGLPTMAARAAGDAAVGRDKAQQCAVCHGIDGLARQPDVPHIAGDSPIYLKKQLEAYRAGERRHEQMSIIAKDLSDEDIADLVAWYARLEISVTMPE